MEPSCTNLSLPRFASNRHGFEVPANPNRILAGSFDNRFLGDLCYRRERAAIYGKLLKLRDTDGIQKQFQ
jgi:hypothetical protein